MIFDIFQTKENNVFTEFVLKNGNAIYGSVSYEKVEENNGVWKGKLLDLSFRLNLDLKQPFASGEVKSIFDFKEKVYINHVYSERFTHESTEKYICTFWEDESKAYTMYHTNPDGKRFICPVFHGEKRIGLLEQTFDSNNQLLSFRIYADTRFESLAVLQMFCVAYHDIIKLNRYKTMSSINEKHDESYKDEILLHNRV